MNESTLKQAAVCQVFHTASHETWQHMTSSEIVIVGNDPFSVPLQSVSEDADLHSQRGAWARGHTEKREHAPKISLNGEKRIAAGSSVQRDG